MKDEDLEMLMAGMSLLLIDLGFRKRNVDEDLSQAALTLGTRLNRRSEEMSIARVRADAPIQDWEPVLPVDIGE